MIPTSYYLALSLAALLAFGLVWWIWRGEKRREPIATIGGDVQVPRVVAVPTKWRNDIATNRAMRAEKVKAQ